MPNEAASRPGSYVYRPLGAFRFLLASLVMIQHFGADLAPEPLRALLAPYYMGDMAVLAFFALSGFVITEAIDCIYRGRPRAFLENRFLRIVPHFVLAVALSMLAHYAFRALDGAVLWRSQPSFPADAFAARNVLLNFLGVLPLVDRFIGYNFLDIAWAVRVEVAFYLVMAACLVLQARFFPRSSFGRIAGLMILPFAVAFALAISGRGIGMFSFVPFFMFGAAWYYARKGSPAGLILALVALPAMIWRCALQIEDHSAAVALPALVGSNLGLFLALLALMCLLSFAGGGRWAPMDQRLGALTYPLYLYHAVVFVAVMTFTTGYSYATLAVAILLSLMVSVAMVAWVDKPINRLRDRIRGTRTAPSPGPDPGPATRPQEA